ncbi:MAG TPA: alpha-E domain-containing protein, partial [Xanthomonadaceae bacterium]|nr:alpha-E domain-containing protein [Xanthomonadaceae bacterium]
MLARTASGMYWMARYMERADYVARLLQVAQHMSAVRVDAESSSEWESAIIAAGGEDLFREHHDAFTPERAVQFLAFSTENPSSIRSCIETARRNARTIRTALTAEMWEAVNGAWLELAGFDPRAMNDDSLGDLVEWVKTRSALFHGVHSNTMLRRDGFHFARLGEFLERADNTARLLDVKYHVRLRAPEDVG